MTADTFLEDRLTSLEVHIIAAEEALAANLGNGGLLTYSYDSGQGRQSVTKASVAELRRSIERMLNQRNALRNRLGYRAPTYGSSAF